MTRGIFSAAARESAAKARSPLPSGERARVRGEPVAATYRLTPSRRAANRARPPAAEARPDAGPDVSPHGPRPSHRPPAVDAGDPGRGRRHRWLVAPYGDVAWVRSARAAGRVTLTRGRRAETVPIRELEPAEAAPVLQRYVTRVPITRPYFDVTARLAARRLRGRSPPPPRLPSLGEEMSECKT